MPKFNDIKLEKWKNYDDVNTESLWLIGKRDNSGKHDGFYHGNFIPQIPQQLLKRFSKENDTILDAFMGSGTTAYECQNLKRNFIGIDIKSEMVQYVKEKLKESNGSKKKENYELCLKGDSSQKYVFNKIKKYSEFKKRKNVQLVILHPPYFDILKFSDNPKDLSNCHNLSIFLNKFSKVLENCFQVLEKDKYLAIIIADKYHNGELVPLGFLCMEEAQKKGLTLKSIIIKNIEGNRAKQGRHTIWRYRALSSDYCIFKHEYIMIFKKNKR